MSKNLSAPETTRKLGKMLGVCAARSEVSMDDRKEATRHVTNSWCLAEMAERRNDKEDERQKGLEDKLIDGE